jgi:hypothetical protein
MATQQTQYQQDLVAIDAGLDQLVEITGKSGHNANLIGTELADQTEMIKETTASMETGQAKIEKAIHETHSVRDMTTGNWIPWILAVLFLIGTIVVWVV